MVLTKQLHAHTMSAIAGETTAPHEGLYEVEQGMLVQATPSLPAPRGFGSGSTAGRKKRSAYIGFGDATTDA